ncbi:MAG: Fe-S protein assembly co-chaperone HscB [Planctomycetota bacterium]
MPENTDQVLPAKCKECEKPMSTPLVCDYCHSLFPQAAAVSDYFTTLGVEQRFDLDENVLREKFLALNRHTHPDYHAEESQEVQLLSLRVSATINDAYRTLKDPASRGEYLLELLGGKSSAEEKSVPEGFLETMMMMQEELADAKEVSNENQLANLRQVLQTQYEGLIHRIAGLFRDFETAAACQAVRTDLLGEIREQLNAVSYVRKLISQLP